MEQWTNGQNRLMVQKQAGVLEVDAMIALQAQV